MMVCVITITTREDNSIWISFLSFWWQKLNNMPCISKYIIFFFTYLQLLVAWLKTFSFLFVFSSVNCFLFSSNCVFVSRVDHWNLYIYSAYTLFSLVFPFFNFQYRKVYENHFIPYTCAIITYIHTLRRVHLHTIKMCCMTLLSLTLLCDSQIKMREKEQIDGDEWEGKITKLFEKILYCFRFCIAKKFDKKNVNLARPLNSTNFFFVLLFTLFNFSNSRIAYYPWTFEIHMDLSGFVFLF